MTHCSCRFLVLALGLAAYAPAQVQVDTIGHTTRDRQVYGPALRYIVNDTLSGVHAVWKDELGEIRYNYRPRRGTWRWPDGTLVNQYPRNLGSLDVDISNGRAMISCDYVAQGRPAISYFKDDAAGQGEFREANVGSGLRECLVGTTTHGWYKFAATRNDTFYYRSLLGGYAVGHLGPFPAGNLAVSKQVGRYGYIWARTDPPDQGKLYLKQTPNNGANWYATSCLSDSVPSPLSRSLLGACATYDSIQVHLVADLYDGTNAGRSQIWHYCPYVSPVWSLVHEYACPESARLGDLALAACRPSIGMDRRRRRLYVVWEQFDPANIDPVTGLARADIWAAGSGDLGVTWGAATRLTPPGPASVRFPFLAEVVNDTLHVICFADSIAGFWEQGQGRQTRNAVLYVRVPGDLLPPAVSEPARLGPLRGPALSTVVQAGSVPHAARGFDPAGRLVPRISGPGVYFVPGQTLRRIVVLP
jgi:hypothetical protein